MVSCAGRTSTGARPGSPRAMTNAPKPTVATAAPAATMSHVDFAVVRAGTAGRVVTGAGGSISDANARSGLVSSGDASWVGPGRRRNTRANHSFRGENSWTGESAWSARAREDASMAMV